MLDKDVLSKIAPDHIVINKVETTGETADQIEYAVEEEIKPLLGEADPEFERLLAEEEEIERSTREHHETPHFRPGDGD
jgi:small subunit ribosomal protein S3